MKLSELIRSGPDATATVATVATLGGRSGSSVARVASVTVANPALFPACSLAEAQSETAGTANDWRALFDERAAILEHDGGIPRDWAEGFAQLDPTRPPGGIPVRRWQAVIDAIGTFLDRWAAKAIANGWQAADIFGADAIRPESNWLNAGPLWAGDGARVIEVHPDRILFETRGGVRQSHPRRSHMRLRLLPWELK
jgi:hypothetical protein